MKSNINKRAKTKRSRWSWLSRSSRPKLRSLAYAGLGFVGLLVLVWVTDRGIEAAHQARWLEIANISVIGLDRVSQNQILASAGYQPGTNILDVDLEETRKAIEEIQWVRHANLKRVWPNEIVITVAERDPIALARIDSEIFQVDTDGVVLPPDSMTDTRSAILDGLRAGDEKGNEIKVRIFERIVGLIGEGGLSEVHIAESGAVSVVPTDNPILVNLGSTDHRIRWERYLGLSERIRRDYPDAFRVDVRFRDQVIIQTEDDEPAGNILWGEETKLL